MLAPYNIVHVTPSMSYYTSTLVRRTAEHNLSQPGIDG